MTLSLNAAVAAAEIMLVFHPYYRECADSWTEDRQRIAEASDQLAAIERDDPRIWEDRIEFFEACSAIAERLASDREKSARQIAQETVMELSP